MDYSKIGIIQMETQSMAHARQRQNILANNISNADTPNFLPTDVTPLDFKNMARTYAHQVQPTLTNPAHMQLKGRKAEFRTYKDKDGSEVTPVGNGVVLEEQMLKMNANASDYAMTTSLYRKNMDMFRNALGGGGAQ